MIFENQVLGIRPAPIFQHSKKINIDNSQSDAVPAEDG